MREKVTSAGWERQSGQSSDYVERSKRQVSAIEMNESTHDRDRSVHRKQRIDHFCRFRQA